MEENKQYSIYVAERLESDEAGDSIHAFLMLVEERDDSQIILQQLHFINDPETLTIIPVAREGITDPKQYPDRSKNLMASKMLQDDALSVLPKWNHMLKYAFLLRHDPIEKLKFSDDFLTSAQAVNCRSLVIAALKTINIQPNKNGFACSAGTNCTQIPDLVTAYNDSNPQKQYADLRRSNKVFMDALEMKLRTVDGFTPDRYTGIFPYKLQPMKRAP